jgi:Concanavalin A-like lectin/glucanases superfamily/Secretion system C-terminal sorting domain/PKD domain
MKKLLYTTFVILGTILQANAQCTTPTISLTLPDTTIAFRVDSILLDAGAGFTTYLWSTGATTRTVWIKSSLKINLTVTNSLAACGKDSTIVLFVKGIQQNDTSICVGKTLNLSIPPSGSIIPSNGLVAWYPFNGNANDASGNGNNGINNGASITSDRFGNPNSSYYFNGSSSYINVPNFNTLQYKPITISLWYNFASLCALSSNDCWKMLIGRDQFGNTSEGNITVLNHSNNSIANKILYYTGGGTNFTNITPTTNYWTNLTFTYDNNSLTKYYINGNLIYSDSFVYSSSSSIPFNIGSGGNRFFYNGNLDDIAIYNRAITPQEVQLIYGGSNTKTKITWSTSDTTNLISVTPTTSTTYSCIQKIGSFILTDSVRVTVNALPVLSLPDTTIAFKQDSIILNAGAGYSKYVWSRGDTTQSIWVKNAGINKVTVFNSAGCSNADSTVVLFVKGILNKDTSVCAKTIVNISATNLINSKYLWSTGDTVSSIIKQIITDSVIKCTYKIGSFTKTDSIRITSITLPIINSLPDTTIAFKQDSIILNAGAGYSKYVWSRGDTTQSIWVKNAGINKVTVFNSAGCSNADSTVVLFVKGIQQKDTSICFGNSIKLSIPSGSIPRNGLVAWYPFNGNANDESGNGNNLISNGSPTFVNNYLNNVNSACNFTSGNDYYLTPSSSFSLINNFSQGTLSFWVKINSHYISNHYFGIDNSFIIKQKHGVGSDLFCGLYGGTTKIRFGVSNVFPNTTDLIGNTNLSINQWYNIIGTWDGTNVKLYVNGVLDGNQVSSVGMSNRSNPDYMSIGSCLYGGNSTNPPGAYGAMSDVVIYNRKISNSEIQALYNGGNANTKCIWSTSDTTNSISTTPTTSTTYRCTQRIGSFTLTDSVRVTVNALPNINSLQDTSIAFKQDSFLLNAGVGYSKYVWSRGDTTQSIWVKNAGVNKVTVFNSAGCSSADSTIAIFVKGIQQKDTSICLGSNIKISLPNAFPTNGQIGWWPFDGNTNDVSGHGNNGVIVGSVSLTTDRNLNPNSAYSFCGSGCYIDCGNNQNVNITGSLTLSAWVYANDLSTERGIITKNQIGNAYQWGVGFYNTSILNFIGQDQSGGNLSTFNWVHLVSVFDSSSRTISLYKNGIMISSQSVTFNSLGVSSDHLCIGTHRPNWTSAWSWDGKLDDIGIWNRALSSTEIQALYSGSGGTKTKITWSTSDTTNSISITPTNSTTYSCTQRIGSFTMTDSIRVSVRNLPSKTITYNKKGLCKNDTISINASPGYAYNWYKNNNIIAGTNNTLKAFANGNYIAKLTDSTGCTSMSDPVILFNAPLPKVNISLPDTALCLNGNVFNYTDSSTLDSGSYNRIWTFGNGNTSILSTSNQSYTSAGNYATKLKVTTNYGCADSALKNITVKPNPVVGSLLGQTNNLSTSTPYIYSVAQQLNHTYNWVVTNGIISAGQGTNNSTVQWVSNGKGYLKVEVTNPQGCIDTAASFINIGNVGINETSNINNLSLYPNPNEGSFTIGFTLKETEQTKLELVNTLGQQVWVNSVHLQNGEQQIPINLPLAAGVYILKITTSTSEITKQVLVK